MNFGLKYFFLSGQKQLFGVYNVSQVREESGQTFVPTITVPTVKHGDLMLWSCFETMRITGQEQYIEILIHDQK